MIERQPYTLFGTPSLNGKQSMDAQTKDFFEYLCFVRLDIPLLKSAPTSAYAVNLPSPQPASEVLPVKL